MSTPKELRAAPTQDFDKYVFTRVVHHDLGLTKVPFSHFKKFTNGVSSSGAANIESEICDIGFKFKFNENFYDRFVVSTNGWLILIKDTDTGSFNLSDYFEEPDAWEEDGYYLMRPLDKFIKPGILLCPWFDHLKSTYGDIEQFLLDLFPSDQDLRNLYNEKFQKGLLALPQVFNETDFGVRFTNTYVQGEGNCLIVRWKSFSHTLFNSVNFVSDTLAGVDFVIQFEVLISESGKIQFKYSNKKSTDEQSSNVDVEGAICGIFLNDATGSPGWNFRDFSAGLGHPKDNDRMLSKYGGFEYDPSYSDESSYAITPYNHTLFITSTDPGSYTIYTPELIKRRISNWPARNSNGCVMTFMPPVNRRKVLPRRDLTFIDSKPSYPQIARTGDVQRMGTRLSMYDDRRSLVFGKTCVVDYPTMLPRDYANSEIGVVDRQNLYGDFEVTSSTPRAIADNFIGNTPVEYVSPFNDHDRPEQHPSSFDSYYMTGSSIEFFGLDLKYPLRSKTQIKMEFPLQHKLQMFETGSAIYYYNKSTKGMLIPQTNNARSDLMNATNSTTYQDVGLYWPEDARGFGPIGNVVASGSNPSPLNPYWSSDPEFGIDSQNWYANTASINLLTRLYEKNVQVNDDYLAGKDEQISIPINQPFLLEKAVFELPMTFGPGWFDDKTTSSTPIGVCGSDDDRGVSTNVFDFAGPAITLSLFNQVSNGLVTHRDLILTGTIIPEGDNVGNVAVRQSWITDETSTYPIWLFEPEGFVKYGVTPSTVVKPNDDHYFTGSVVIRTEAGVSNGVVLRQKMDASNFDTPGFYYDERAEFVKSFMTSPEINIYQPQVGGGGKSFVGVSNVKSVNPFSRDSRGNNISGRSLYGKEYTTFQLANNGKVTNPLYVSSSFNDFPAALKSVLDTSTNPDFQAWFQYAIPVEKSMPSPYLLLPGDNLVFALSKNRPALHTNGFLPVAGTPVDFWRNGLRHDVWVNTGSIKVTLYGSLLREGKEFHDTLNQSLDSNSAHNTIGMDPVCDQFQVEYDDSFYGTYTDGYMTGSMFQISGKLINFADNGTTVTKGVGLEVRGSQRARLFSKTEEVSPVYSTDIVNRILFNSKSARLQPLRERVGSQRHVRISSEVERIYDTLMPDFNQCLRLNGKSIHHLGYPEEIFQPATKYYDRDKTYGVIFLNSVIYDTPGFDVMSDNDWSYSFPFEAKYSSVERKKDANKNIVTTFSASILDGSALSTEISFKKIDHLLICQREGNAYVNVMCDADLSKTVTILPSITPRYVTSSMSRDDMSKVLYGFGDDNTIDYPIGSTDYVTGHNHQPLFRNEHKLTTVTGLEYVKFQYSPVIRGWKYGVFSGLPTYSSVVFNRNRFGQFRDMLEQRLDTKFYTEDLTEDGRNAGNNNSTGTSPVRIRFINTSTGDITSPENTWGSNIHFEAASIVPYFDGIATNREYDINNLNQTLVELTL